MYASWTTEEFALGTINRDAMTDVMEDSVTDFVFGCTKQSTRLPLGSIGFDSSPESLPSQLVHENSLLVYCHTFMMTLEDIVR
ncbi:hypothetical protein CerSpe_247770 [Prunus speciosa]